MTAGHEDPMLAALLLDESAEALYAVSLDGRVLSWNRGAERLFGYAAEEAVGKTLRSLILSDEEHDAAARAFRDACAGTLVRRDMVRRARDDSRRDVEVSMRRVDPQGHAPFIAVSERRSSELWRGLLETAPDAMLIVNTGGVITQVNAQAERLFGHSRSDLVDQAIEMLIPERYRARHVPKRDEFFDAPRVRAMGSGLELFGLRKDGSEFGIEVSLGQLYLDGEMRVLAAIRDIGDRKKAEALFRGLLESAPDAMVIVDNRGQILLVNAQTEALFGYPREDLIGQPVEILIPERFHNVHPGHRQGYATVPRVRSMGSGLELNGRRKDATEFPIEISLSPITTPDGVLVSAAIRDVSERRGLERRLQEASRLKSEFLANMSHELRTPLNAIIGFTDLMLDGSVGPVAEEHREYLGDIMTSSRHLLGLINDVLDLAKVESGKMEFRLSRVELSRLIREVRDILRGLAASKRLFVESEVAPEVDWVFVDPSRVKQVLYNFLSNAIKFTPTGGRIVIRARPENAGDFRLEVEDSGIGILPENISRLFIEFQQLDAGSTKKHQGTGLGLALTKRVVEAHGGRVEVSSVPGKGSIFAAILPRSVASLPAPEPETRPASSTPAVLVIDDDPNDREWLTQTLRRAGYLVEAVGTGVEALARCRTRRYRAVTLDLLLPDMLGREVLAALRATPGNADLPVIVVTACDARGRPHGFRVEDYLEKPISDEKLVEALRRAGVAPGGGGVLIVDNDPISAKIAQAALAPLGFRIRAELSGAAALRAAADEPPDVVVLDLMMPGMDGLDFVTRFRRTEAGRAVPVIVWTGKDVSAEERAKLRGLTHAILGKSDGASALLDELRSRL